MIRRFLLWVLRWQIISAYDHRHRFFQLVVICLNGRDFAPSIGCLWHDNDWSYDCLGARLGNVSLVEIHSCWDYTRRGILWNLVNLPGLEETLHSWLSNQVNRVWSRISQVGQTNYIVSNVWLLNRLLCNYIVVCVLLNHVCEAVGDVIGYDCQLLVVI